MLPPFPGDPSGRWHSFAGENSLDRPQKSRGVIGEGSEGDMEGRGGDGKDASWLLMESVQKRGTPPKAWSRLLPTLHK